MLNFFKYFSVLHNTSRDDAPSRKGGTFGTPVYYTSKFSAVGKNIVDSSSHETEFNETICFRTHNVRVLGTFVLNS
jgi:hypothetical protein